MAKYRFRVQITLWGDYDAEIGDQDPEKFAEELEETVVVSDLNVMNDETEVNDWDKIDG